MGIPPGNRIFKTLKTRAQARIDPNRATASKRVGLVAPLLRKWQKSLGCSVQCALMRSDSWPL